MTVDEFNVFELPNSLTESMYFFDILGPRARQKSAQVLHRHTRLLT